MKRISILGTALAAFSAFLPLSGFAAGTDASPTGPATDTDDGATTSLSPVVVTATRMATSAADSTSSVTVISRQEMEERQYQDVAQALQQVPGLSLSTPGTPGQTTAVLTRGLNTDQTLILVNGVRLPQDLAGAYDLTNLPLDNVDRIEVVRGPLSAVQGGGASGGVINIITRNGQGLEKPEYTASSEFGSYNTFHEAVTARGMQGPFDYSVAASSLDTSFQRPNNDYERENADGNFGYQVAPGLRLTLATNYRSSYTGNPGPTYGFVPNDPSSWLLRENWSATPTLQWKTTENWTQTLTYQRAQQRQVFSASPANVSNGIDSTRYQIDANEVTYDSAVEILDNLKLDAGGEFRDYHTWQVDDTVGGLTYDNAQTNLAGFTSLDYEPIKGWTIDPSVRIDRYSDFGVFANGRIASGYRVQATRTLFHASYGTATTVPDDQNFLTYGGFQNPNYSLKPDQTKGFDAGVEQPFFGGKWTVGATYFQNNVKDLPIYSAPGNTIVNINQARTQGLELSSTAHPIEQLDLTLAYTYLDAENLSGTTAVPPPANTLLLPLRPRNTLTFAVTGRPVKNVSVTAEGGWYNGMQGPEPVAYAQTPIDGYFTSRLAATWKINPHLELFARMENALNNKYQESIGYPEPDQGFYGGLKLTY